MNVEDRTVPGWGRTFHKANLAGDEYAEGDADRPVVELTEANVVSSLRRGEQPGPYARHRPVLDLDLDAHLVPSSTPGHWHLYIERDVPDDLFWELCDLLAKVGILQDGYVSACKSRGYTSVRLPWVKKETAATEVAP